MRRLDWSRAGLLASRGVVFFRLALLTGHGLACSVASRLARSSLSDSSSLPVAGSVARLHARPSSRIAGRRLPVRRAAVGGRPRAAPAPRPGGRRHIVDRARRRGARRQRARSVAGTRDEGRGWKSRESRVVSFQFACARRRGRDVAIVVIDVGERGDGKGFNFRWASRVNDAPLATNTCHRRQTRADLKSDAVLRIARRLPRSPCVVGRPAAAPLPPSRFHAPSCPLWFGSS